MGSLWNGHRPVPAVVWRGPCPELSAKHFGFPGHIDSLENVLSKFIQYFPKMSFPNFASALNKSLISVPKTGTCGIRATQNVRSSADITTIIAFWHWASICHLLNISLAIALTA
jgi:hypothetical protein